LKHQIRPKKIILNSQMLHDTDLMDALKTSPDDEVTQKAPPFSIPLLRCWCSMSVQDEIIKLLNNRCFSLEEAMRQLQHLHIQTGAKESNAVNIRTDNVRNFSNPFCAQEH
jgi:hypothetical protein